MSSETDEDDDRPPASARVEEATPPESTGEPVTSTGESVTSTSDRSHGPDDEQPRRHDDEQVRRSSDDGGASLEADGFGAKGWVLTAVLFVSVIVIPGIIYAYPYAAGGLGFTFFATYLALPLVPAALLGLVAVWSMTAAVADD